MARLGICFLLILLALPVQAWNAKAHRLNVAVALTFIPEARQEALLALLTQHPRYTQDFLRQMPASVTADPVQRRQWLLGQAAVWPDLARQFSRDQQSRFHRPAWHYIDGRWMAAGSESVEQGNIYLGLPAMTDVHGPLHVARAADVSNMIQALAYNLKLLQDEAQPAPDRAIALCWVLHLVGDIHQPLHSGALFSPALPAGDRGGNAIPTDRGNLHARWDQALGPRSFSRLLPILITRATTWPATVSESGSLVWLQESRRLLQSAVYRTDMKQWILQSETDTLRPLLLDDAYIRQMEEIALERIALAGRRLAALIADTTVR